MAFNLTAQLNVALNTASLKNAANTINSQLKDVGAVSLGLPKDSGNSLKYIKVQAEEASTAMEQFGRQSGLAAKRFVAFTLTAGAIITFTSSLKQALTSAVDFDREMIRLTQVSTDSVGQVGAVGSEVSRLAKNFGVSSKDLLTTAVTLKQANLSLADTKVALEALAQAALAPSFDNLRDTTEGAIAVMNQFGISAKDLGNALGAINAVAAEFAVEAQDLIEGVRKAGGAFKSAGGDLNEFLALFTSIRQTTRESAESIGTGLRTIFTRVQRNETVEALKDIGVQLRYTADEAKAAGDLGLANQFVGPYEAVKRLSGALNELRSTDPRFSAIIEELGGYRQISKVIPLIQEFGVAQKALGVAQIGGASLALNAAQAQEAFGVKIQKVKEEFSDFIRNLTNTSSFKALIDLLLGAASAGIALADSLKGVLPVITAIAAVKTAQSLTGFAKGFGSTAFSPAPANQPSTFSPFLPTGGRKASGGIIKMAKGGIVPGVGRGDKVPALLEPGELVIPRSRFGGGGSIEADQFISKELLLKLFDSSKNPKDKDYRDGTLINPNDTIKYNIISFPLEDQKSAKLKSISAQGNSFEIFAAERLAASRTKPGFPVDLIGKIPYEVKNVGEAVSDAELVDKLARYQIRIGNQKKLSNSIEKDNLINLGSIGVVYNTAKFKEGEYEQLVKDKNYTQGDPSLANAQNQKLKLTEQQNSVLKTSKLPQKKVLALGGLVPGVGNTDSVPLDLPIGSYVIKKSSVNSIGASNLSRLGRASGGVIPSLVMPGEYIYSPDETKQIGVSNLNYMNTTGRKKFASGGYGTLTKEEIQNAKQIERQYRIPTNAAEKSQNRQQAIDVVKDMNQTSKDIVALQKTIAPIKKEIAIGVKFEKLLNDIKKDLIDDLTKQDAAVKRAIKAEQKDIRAGRSTTASTAARVAAEQAQADTTAELARTNKELSDNRKRIGQEELKKSRVEGEVQVLKNKYKKDENGNITKDGQVITSTFGNSYNKILEKELSNYKKLYGEEATGSTRKALTTNVNDRAKAGYFQQLKSFSEAKGLEFNEKFANDQAQQMASEVEAGRRKVQTTAKGEFYDENLAKRLKKEGYSETGKKGIGRKISDFAKTTFSRENLQNNIFAASTGLGMIGGSFDLSDAKAKEAVSSKNEAQYKANAAGAGLFTGVAAGASVGSFLGPWGIAVGAAVGGLTGFVNGLKDAEKQIADIKLEQAGTQLKNAFAVAATSFEKIAATTLKEITDLQDKIDTAIAEKSKASVTQFSLTNSGVQEAKSAKAERRTQYAGQASGIDSLLSKQIEEEIKSSIAFDEKTKTFKPRDDQKFDPSKFFEDTSNSAQIGKLSIGLDQPIEKLKKKFETFARDFEKQQIAIKNQTLSVKSTEQLNVAFSLLANASSNAASTLNNLSPAFQTITDALSSNFSISQKKRISSDVQSSFLNPNMFVQNLKDVSSGLGSSGSNFEKSGNIVANISALLPDILANINPNDVKGGKDPQSVLRGVLTQELNNRGFNKSDTTAYVNSIVGKMGEDFSKMLAESGGDYGEFAKKIMSGVSEPFLKAYQNIAADLEKASDAYVSGINKLAQETIKTVNEYEKLGKIQQQTRNFKTNIDIENEIKKQKTANPLGARFGEIKEGQIGLDMTNIFDQTQAFAEQQARLTGLNNGNQLDPQQIQDRINQNRINTEAAETRRKNARFTAGANGRGQDTDATNELGRLKVEASLLNQAMRNLADSTEEVSAIEQRVGKIRQEIANEEQDNARKQSETENRGERLLTSSPEQLQRLQAGSQLTSIAKELGGNLLRFNVEQRKAIFEYLDFSGEEGKKLKSEFLQASGFVSKPETKVQDKYGPQLLQLNAQLFAAMAVREQAQSLIIKDQQTLQGQFFAELSKQNEQFFTRLSAELTRTQIGGQEQSLRANDARIKELQAVAPSASALGNMVTQESYTKYVAPNSKDISVFLASVEKQRSSQKKAEEFRDTNQADVIAGKSLGQNNVLDVNKLLNNLAANKNLQGLDINAIIEQVQERSNKNGGKIDQGTLASLIRLYAGGQFQTIQNKEVQTQSGELANKLGLSRQLDANNDTYFTNDPNAQGDKANLGSFVLNLLQQNVSSSAFSKAIDDIQRLGGLIGGQFFQQIEQLQTQSTIAANSIQNLNAQLNLLNIPVNQVAPVNPLVPRAGGRSTGGMVTHASAMVGADPKVFKPIGPDTIPTMLNHGEYVVNAKATSENLPLLQALNGGGTVKPTKAMNAGGPVNYLAEGGFGDLFAPLNVNRLEAQKIAKMQRQQNVDIAVLTKFGNLRGSWRRNALNNSLRILRGSADLTHVPYRDGAIPISAIVSKQNIAPWSKITDIKETGLNIENLSVEARNNLLQMTQAGAIYGMPLAIKQVPYQQILDATEDYLRANANPVGLDGRQAVDPVDRDGNTRSYYERRANLKPYFEDLLMAGSPPEITTIGAGYFERAYGLKSIKNIKAIGFSKGGQAGGRTPAMIQRGEFIVSADKAKKNKGLLDHMNGGGKVSYLSFGGMMKKDEFMRNSFSPGIENMLQTFRNNDSGPGNLKIKRMDPLNTNGVATRGTEYLLERARHYLGERIANQFSRILSKPAEDVGPDRRVMKKMQMFQDILPTLEKNPEELASTRGFYNIKRDTAVTLIRGEAGPVLPQSARKTTRHEFGGHALTYAAQKFGAKLKNSVFGSIGLEMLENLFKPTKTVAETHARIVEEKSPAASLKRMIRFLSSQRAGSSYGANPLLGKDVLGFHAQALKDLQGNKGQIPIDGLLSGAGKGKEAELFKEFLTRAGKKTSSISEIAGKSYINAKEFVGAGKKAIGAGLVAAGSLAFPNMSMAGVSSGTKDQSFINPNDLNNVLNKDREFNTQDFLKIGAFGLAGATVAGLGYFGLKKLFSGKKSVEPSIGSNDGPMSMSKYLKPSKQELSSRRIPPPLVNAGSSWFDNKELIKNLAVEDAQVAKIVQTTFEPGFLEVRKALEDTGRLKLNKDLSYLKPREKKPRQNILSRMFKQMTSGYGKQGTSTYIAEPKAQEIPKSPLGVLHDPEFMIEAEKYLIDPNSKSINPRRKIDQFKRLLKLEQDLYHLSMLDNAAAARSRIKRGPHVGPPEFGYEEPKNTSIFTDEKERLAKKLYNQPSNRRIKNSMSVFLEKIDNQKYALGRGGDNSGFGKPQVSTVYDRSYTGSSMYKSNPAHYSISEKPVEQKGIMGHELTHSIQDFAQDKMSPMHNSLYGAINMEEYGKRSSANTAWNKGGISTFLSELQANANESRNLKSGKSRGLMALLSMLDHARDESMGDIYNSGFHQSIAKDIKAGKPIALDGILGGKFGNRGIEVELVKEAIKRAYSPDVAAEKIKGLNISGPNNEASIHTLFPRKIENPIVDLSKPKKIIDAPDINTSKKVPSNKIPSNNISLARKESLGSLLLKAGFTVGGVLAFTNELKGAGSEPKKVYTGTADKSLTNKTDLNEVINFDRQYNTEDFIKAGILATGIGVPGYFLGRAAVRKTIKFFQKPVDVSPEGEAPVETNKPKLDGTKVKPASTKAVISATEAAELAKYERDLANYKTGDVEKAKVQKAIDDAKKQGVLNNELSKKDKFKFKDESVSDLQKFEKAQRGKANSFLQAELDKIYGPTKEETRINQKGESYTIKKNRFDSKGNPISIPFEAIEKIQARNPHLLADQIYNEGRSNVAKGEVFNRSANEVPLTQEYIIERNARIAKNLAVYQNVESVRALRAQALLDANVMLQQERNANIAHQQGQLDARRARIAEARAQAANARPVAPVVRAGAPVVPPVVAPPVNPIVAEKPPVKLIPKVELPPEVKLPPKVELPPEVKLPPKVELPPEVKLPPKVDITTGNKPNPNDAGKGTDGRTGTQPSEVLPEAKLPPKTQPVVAELPKPVVAEPIAPVAPVAQPKQQTIREILASKGVTPSEMTQVLNEYKEISKSGDINRIMGAVESVREKNKGVSVEVNRQVVRAGGNANKIITNSSKFKMQDGGKTIAKYGAYAQMALPLARTAIVDSMYGVDPSEIRKKLGEEAATSAAIIPLFELFTRIPRVAPFAGPLGLAFLPQTARDLEQIGTSLTSDINPVRLQKAVETYGQAFPEIANLYDKKKYEDSKSIFGGGNADTTVSGELLSTGGTIAAGALAGTAIPIPGATLVGAGIGLIIAQYKTLSNAYAKNLKKEKREDAKYLRKYLQPRFDARGMGGDHAAFFDDADNESYTKELKDNPSLYLNKYADELESYGMVTDSRFKDLTNQRYLNENPYTSIEDAILFEKLKNKGERGIPESFISEISPLQKSGASEGQLNKIREKYNPDGKPSDSIDSILKKLGKGDSGKINDYDKSAIFGRLFKQDKNILNISELGPKILFDNQNEEKIVEIAKTLGVKPSNDKGYPIKDLNRKYEVFDIESIRSQELYSKIEIAERLKAGEDQKIKDTGKKLRLNAPPIEKRRSDDYLNEQSAKVSSLMEPYLSVGDPLVNKAEMIDADKEKRINLKNILEQELFGGVYKEETTKDNLLDYISLIKNINDKIYYNDENNGLTEKNYAGLWPQYQNIEIEKRQKENALILEQFSKDFGKKLGAIVPFFNNNLFDTELDALQYSSNDGKKETKEDFFKYDSNKLKKDLSIPDEKEVVSKDIYEYFEKNKGIKYNWIGAKEDNFGKPLAMASGGIVPSSAPNPDPSFFVAKGSDTVPAILSSGEYVVNARATAANLPLLQNLNSGGAVKYLYRGGDLQAINPYYAAYTRQSPGRGYIGSNGRDRTDFDIGAQGYLASKNFNPMVNTNVLGNLANYMADRTGSLNKPGYGRYTFNNRLDKKHLAAFGSEAPYGSIGFGGGPIPNFVGGLNALSDSSFGSPRMAGAAKFSLEDWAFQDILNNREISRGPIGGYQMSNVGSRYISGLIGGPPADKVSLKDYMNELGFSKAGNQTFNGVSANKALAMGSLADTPGSNVGIAQQAISSIQTKGLGNLSVNNTDVAASTALDTIKNARMSHYSKQMQIPQQRQPQGIDADNPMERNRIQGNPVFNSGPVQPFRFFANGGSTTDTQPAMLTPGEFVVSKPAVDRVGTAFLDRVNNYAKGGKVGYYQNGTGSSNSGSGPILGVDFKILQSASENLQGVAGLVSSAVIQLGTSFGQAAGTITSSMSLIDKVGSLMNSSSSAMYSSSLAFERAVNNLASALDRVPKTINLAIAPLSLNVSFNTPSVLAAIQQSLSGITTNVAGMIRSAIEDNNNDQMRRA